MTQAEAIGVIAAHASANARFVSTTGLISRQLHSHRGGDERCFYMLGSMGLALAVGVGLAVTTTEPILVLDGDGSVAMGMASLLLAGDARPIALHHIVLANGCYASTGGQRVAGQRSDWPELARAAGYARANAVSDATELAAEIGRLSTYPGPTLLLARLDPDTLPFPSRVAARPEEIVERVRRYALEG